MLLGERERLALDEKTLHLSTVRLSGDSQGAMQEDERRVELKMQRENLDAIADE